VVDTFQGQLKSHVKCPDCPRVNVTFDPYMFLSVPLPLETIYQKVLHMVFGARVDPCVKHHFRWKWCSPAAAFLDKYRLSP
jgi:ubiquitin carboxyl-terminal hydrolase 4/11/15